EPEHADDAEQPVADDQRLDDRVPSADADELRLGIRRRGIVVDEAALPLEGAGADETESEGDALIDRGALAPGARCQRLARRLHQVDRALGPEETTGVLHDQREQPIEVELGGQLAVSSEKSRAFSSASAAWSANAWVNRMSASSKARPARSPMPSAPMTRSCTMSGTVSTAR